MVDPKFGDDATGEFESELYKFRTVNGAIRVAKRYASSANPVRVSLAPGSYFEGRIKLYDGLSIEATGRLTAMIYGYFDLSHIGTGSATVLEISMRAYNTPVIINSAPGTNVPTATFRRMSLISTFTNQASQQFVVNAPGSQIAISDNSEVQLISYGGGEAANFNYVNTQLAVQRTTNSNSVTLIENNIVPAGVTVELTASTPQLVELNGNNTVTIRGGSSYVLVQNGGKPSTINFATKAYDAATGKLSQQITLTKNQRLDIFAYQVVSSDTSDHCRKSGTQTNTYYSFNVTVGGRRRCQTCSSSLTSSIYRVSSEGPNLSTLDSGVNTIIPFGESATLIGSGGNIIEMFGNALTLTIPNTASGPSLISSHVAFLNSVTDKIHTKVTVHPNESVNMQLVQLWINQEKIPKLILYYSYAIGQVGTSMVTSNLTVKANISAMVLASNYRGINHNALDPNLSLAVHLEHTDENHSTSGGVVPAITGQVTVTINGGGGTEMSPYTVTSTDSYIIAIGAVTIIFNSPAGVNPPSLTIDTTNNAPNVMITLIPGFPVSISLPGRSLYSFRLNSAGLELLANVYTTLQSGDSFTIPNFDGILLSTASFTINTNTNTTIIGSTGSSGLISPISLVSTVGGGSVTFQNITNSQSVPTPFTGSLTLSNQMYVLSFTTTSVTVPVSKDRVHHRSYLKQTQTIAGGNTTTQSIYVPQYPPSFVVVINNPVAPNLQTLQLYGNSSQIYLNDNNLTPAQLATYPQYIVVFANSQPLTTPTLVFGVNLRPRGVPVPLGTNGPNSSSITFRRESDGYVEYGRTSGYNSVENVSLDNDVLVTTGAPPTYVNSSNSPYPVLPTDVYIIATGAVSIIMPAVSSFLVDTSNNSLNTIVSVYPPAPVTTVFPLSGQSLASFSSGTQFLSEVVVLGFLMVSLKPNDVYTVLDVISYFNNARLPVPYTINLNTNTTVNLPSSPSGIMYTSPVTLNTITGATGNVTIINVTYQNILYTSSNPLILALPITGSLTFNPNYTLTLTNNGGTVAIPPTSNNVVDIAPIPFDTSFRRRIPIRPNLNLTTATTIHASTINLPFLGTSTVLTGLINQVSNGPSTLYGTYDLNDKLVPSIPIYAGQVYTLYPLIISRGLDTVIYGFNAQLKSDNSNVNLSLNKVTVTNGNNVPQLLLSNHPSAMVHNDKITAFQGKKLLQVSFPKGNQASYPVHEHSTQGEHRHGGTFNSTLTNLVVNQTYDVTQNDKIVVVGGGATVNLPLIVTLNGDRAGGIVPVGTITAVFGTQYDIITELGASTPSTIVAATGDLIESPPGTYQQSITLPPDNNVIMTSLYNADKTSNNFVWVPSYTTQTP